LIDYRALMTALDGRRIGLVWLRACRCAAIAAVLVVVLVLAVASASGRQSDGRLVGLFTLTGSCEHGCTFALGGVVTLTSRAGKVRRIEVNPNDHLRPSKGRFSAKLPRGTYRISDNVIPRLGGGSCGVYLTGGRFRIVNAYASVTSISIKPGQSTYVHINCFGH
jgi:hypothetical protein